MFPWFFDVLLGEFVALFQVWAHLFLFLVFHCQSVHVKTCLAYLTKVIDELVVNIKMNTVAGAPNILFFICICKGNLSRNNTCSYKMFETQLEVVQGLQASPRRRGLTGSGIAMSYSQAAAKTDQSE